MADPYNVGTASVPNGGTTVTGTGTFWVGKARKNDMYFVPAQGLQARITADATDNEELEITPWAGTSLTDAAYEIIPAGDATTSAARLRDLLAQMSVVEANGRGLFFRFSDTVTDADPGAGIIRLNNADPTLATAAYIDVLDANGASVSGEIDTWDDSTSLGKGNFWVRSIADPTAFRAYSVTGAVVDGTGYRKLTLTHIGGSGSFAADDELMVAFARTGDAGDGYVTDATVADPSELAALESEAPGYLVFVTDLQTDFGAYSGRSGVVRLIAGPDWEIVALYTGPKGNTGDQGEKGWSPQIVVVADGARRVHQLAGYVGGAGTAPTANVGEYLKGDGTFTATIGDAADIRGPAGLNGAGTVASVESGAGTSVDVTDPTAPIVNVVAFTGDSGAGGALGGVPAPAAGDAADKFLSADGTWKAVEIPATVDANLVALNTFRIADLMGQQIGFGGGFADPFDDDTGIDPALSSNYTYDAANDRFMPTVSGLARITGATESAPFGAGSNIANINDNNPATTGSNLPGAMGGQPVGNRRVFQLDLGSSKAIKRAELKQIQISASASVSDNGFFTSVDGTTWTAYGATTGFSTSPADYVITIDRTVRYVAWTVEATAWSTFSLILGDLNVYEAAPPSNMTVVSDTLALPSAPDTVRVLVEIYAAEAVTVNTDFTLEATRDDGTTFSAGSLTQYFGNFYEAVIDVSGQPAGNDLRLRFKSLNNKNVGVAGWFAQVI